MPPPPDNHDDSFWRRVLDHWPQWLFQAIFTFTLVLILAWCGRGSANAPANNNAPAPTAAAELPFTLPGGYTARLVVTDLRGPTQVIAGPTPNTLWLAQLNGPENARTGQILAVDLTTGQQTVLLANLDKPTGLALLNNALWIATRDQLLRAPLSNAGPPETPVAVLSNLPNNGRSNGTLTVTPAGFLLFETSGSRVGATAARNSGILWQLDPADPANPIPLATGFKGAYAHTFDSTGQLWATEIADGTVNAQPIPDELNRITPGGFYGWPRCLGDNLLATSYGAQPGDCNAALPPVALFGPAATPVSLVESPFQPGVLLVALWGPTTPSVVAVDTTVTPATVTPFLTGLAHPQSLLALSPAQLLITDYDTGQIWAVTPVN